MRRPPIRPGSSRLLLALGSVALFLLLGLNGSLFSSSWCDRRLAQITEQKDREIMAAMEQLQASLTQQAETLERLHAIRARGGRSPRVVRDRLDQLVTNQPPGEGAASLQTAGFLSGASAGRLCPEQIAVVVIAYNRPEYLERALTSIFSHHPGGNAFPVFVSQDGADEGVTQVALRHGARSLVHPRRNLDLRGAPTFLRKAPGYAYLSVHYGWALRTLFAAPQHYEGVIILEEDLEVAPDFFDYFNATAPLLYQDPSLLTISAFNDNGQLRYASDPSAVYRSDFFPGLGWLLSRRLWEELGPKWPEEKGFWDDWMREPPQRRGRSSIRPEVSRSRTFGQKGTSMSQFYTKYLAPIQFDPSGGVSWIGRDLTPLLKEKYEANFHALLKMARVVLLNEALALGHSADADGAPVRVMYSSAKELKTISHELGIMEDLKAGVPRTGYHGVIQLRMGRTPVLLAPSYKVDQDITKPITT